jgi:NADH-quinone oxidoreductase subunit C
MNTPEAIQLLKRRFGDAVTEQPAFRDEQGVCLPRERLSEACRLLKTEAGFNVLTDLAGVDNADTSPRFEVHYLLYSLSARCRLRLVVGVPSEDPVVDTVSDVWATANWHEREAFDMFGLQFRGHPDLRRILMWDGYSHHPLRKDFPVAGLPANLPSTAVDSGAVESAPMAGGPFVSATGTRSSPRREPRSFETAAARDRAVTDPDRKEEI